MPQLTNTTHSFIRKVQVGGSYTEITIDLTINYTGRSISIIERSSRNHLFDAVPVSRAKAMAELIMEAVEFADKALAKEEVTVTMTNGEV